MMRTTRKKEGREVNSKSKEYREFWWQVAVLYEFYIPQKQVLEME
jgi:hypothetical protein